MSVRLDRHGPWALIAGASEGIGAAFARELAARGFKLLLLARRPEPLEALAAELRGSVEVRVASVDLSAPSFADELPRLTDGLDIGLVIANAALSLTADFVDLSLADVQRTVDLNVRAPLVLAHHFTSRFVAREKGGFIWMSSLAAFTGAPRVAAYAGTKSFAFGFVESLYVELKPRGVDVLVVGAGPTHTPTYDAVSTSSFPPAMRAEDVAKEALSSLGDTPRLFPGLGNKLTALLLRLLPRAFSLTLVGMATKQYSARKRQ